MENRKVLAEVNQDPKTVMDRTKDVNHSTTALKQTSEVSNDFYRVKRGSGYTG